jgi:HAE1 family hydrophobic/amphiphilic exporter-1
MLASTAFGIFLIPVLYYIFQSASEKGHAWRQRHKKMDDTEPTGEQKKPTV